MKRLLEPPAEAAHLAPAGWPLATAVLFPFFTATVYVTARMRASSAGGRGLFTP